MSTPLVGMTYPTVTGETKLAALQRIKDEFPNMQVWSQYWEPGKGYPTFSEEFWNELPESVELVLISVKDSNVATLVSRFVNIPEPWRGKVAVTINHEPDQWRSATDTHGDMSPTAWWAAMQQLLNAREGAVWETWVLVYYCFTEDRFRTDKAFWEQNWGSKVRTDPRVDFIVWDCFNIGRTIVRQGQDIFGACLDWVRNLPFVVRTGFREYGQVTPKDQAADSEQVVAGIAENWSYLKAQNTDDVVAFLVWYYNHNNTLADPTRVRRPQTRGLLQEIVTEAYEADTEEPPVEDPDPNHPQYGFGYANGHIDGLEEGRQAVISAVTAALIPFVTEEGEDAERAAG